MKLNITVDCTPEEARSFLGLPNLTPVNETLSVAEGLPAVAPARSVAFRVTATTVPRASMSMSVAMA